MCIRKFIHIIDKTPPKRKNKKTRLGLEPGVFDVSTMQIPWVSRVEGAVGNISNAGLLLDTEEGLEPPILCIFAF